VVFCSFRYRGAIQNCLNRSSAQIFRIRLCHPCWPPASRTLESDSLWNVNPSIQPFREVL
jgi:hypothetical protein